MSNEYQDAELVDNSYESYPAQNYPIQSQQDEELFGRQNDLRVIQEYNREENMPQEVRMDFWALGSKSLKLGFWEKNDYPEVFLHENIIKVGHLMANPRYNYTFKDRQAMNQISTLVFFDFKRGVGMEKYKINERTLQASSIQQSIQGGGGGGGRKGGFIAGLKSFFS